MDDINFDDVPFEKDTGATATPPEDISFDDVPMEEPKQALPTSPEPKPSTYVGRMEGREPDSRVYDPFYNEPTSATAKRRGQQFVRGATETIATAPEAAAIANRMRQRRVQETSADVLKTYPKEVAELRSIIDENSALAERGDGEAVARVRGAELRLANLENQLRMANQMEQDAASSLTVPIQQTPGFQAAQSIRKGVYDLVGAPDDRDQSFWGKLAEGGGNLTGMAITSLATSTFLTPIGGAAVGAAQGAAMNSASTYKEAIVSGADEKTAEEAAKWSALFGTTEVIPITRAFKMLPPQLSVKVTNAFLKRIAEIGQTAGEEALQEYTQQVAQNLIAKGYYDPDRGWSEGALEAGALGGILGGGMGAAAQIGRPTELADEKAPSPDETEALKPVPQTPTSAPPQNVSPDAQEALRATQTLAPAPTPPPVVEATPTLPPEPAPTPPPVVEETQPPAPLSQAERIREIARQRQAAQQATAPQPDTAAAAEGPQVGGPPAAPTTPPVTSAGKPAPKAEAPKRVRTFTSESAPDILHSAGLKTGEIAGMKKGAQTQLVGLIRSAMKSQFTPEELNTMPREDYNAAVKTVYEEIKAATAPAPAPAPALRRPAPAPAPVGETPPITETQTPPAPVQEAPVAAPAPAPAPSITEAPSEGRKVTVSDEEKARLIAEMNAKLAPKVAPAPVPAPKAAQAINTSQERTGRVLEDITPEGKAKAAEAAKQAQVLAAKQEAEAAVADEAREKLAAGPVGAKMNPVEVARRQSNKAAAEEIVKTFAPDNKAEKDFTDNTYEGNKAREAVWARAKRMLAAAEKRLSADANGNKLPKNRKSSAKEEQALSPETLLLMEARSLANMKRPSAQAVARFRSAEALLRSGMVDEYMAARRGDVDTANRKTADLKTEEGESIDAAQTLPDERATPEAVLEDKQDAEEEPMSEPIGFEQERPAVATDKNLGAFVTIGANRKQPPVITVTRSGKRVADAAKKLLTPKFNRKGKQKPSRNPNLQYPDHFPHTKMTLSEAIDKADGGPLSIIGTPLGRKIVSRILGRLKEGVGDVEVFILADADLQSMVPGADGFYDPNTNQIAISQDRVYGDKIDAQLLAHEGLHALLFHAIELDPVLNAELQMLVKATAAVVPEADQFYGFTRDKNGEYDIHEFLTEALTDPDFQELMADIELPEVVANRFGLSEVYHDKSVWGALLRIVRKFIMGERQQFGDSSQAFTVLDAIMRAAAYADDKATEMRAIRGEKAVAPGPAQRTLFSDKRPLSNYNRLRAGGVPHEVARDINNFLKAEVGKSVDPATVPLLIDDYIAAFGVPKLTSAGKAAPAAPSGPTPTSGNGGIQPPYQAPNTPGMGPGKPSTPVPPGFKGKDEGRIKPVLRWLAVKNASLDFLRQRYRKFFDDAKGNALDDAIIPLQRRQSITDDFAKPINEITAEFTDLQRENPAMAQELAEIAMAATVYNVQVGPGGKNGHLGKNKASGLQGKQNLPELNRRFSLLSPKAQDIYKRLTTAYRDAHNQNVEALAYNVISMLEPKLSTGDVIYLMQRTVDGKLDANDATLINDKIVFNALKNAQELKRIDGDYFPQMRFGDFVVQTSEKLDNPNWTSVPLKRAVATKGGGKRTMTASLPARTEVDGPNLRVIVDPKTRGATTAARRAMHEYASKHSLTLQGITTRFRDRVTGALVTKGEQIVGRDYDTVIEARFQTEGVHYFDDRSSARAFQKDVPSHLTSQVLTRRNANLDEVISGSMLADIVKRIDGSNLKPGEKTLFRNVVKNAIVASMDGNSARSRYIARRNVKGASADIARAAVTYGQAAGNYYATLLTAPDMREAMQRISNIETGSKYTDNGAAISDVVNELRQRMDGSNYEPMGSIERKAQYIAQLSFFDKLVTPSHSFINGMQPLGTTLPIAAGRYGAAKATAFFVNAYRKAGVVDAITSGGKNTYRAVRDIRRTAINTEDVIGDMKKRLGQEYEALIDSMVDRGVVSADTGQEVAAAVENGVSRTGTVIGRVDRAARQLPNAVEVVNRIVSAVTMYDLAKSAGKGKQEAITEAIDTVFNTQGDYRAMNAPRWMQAKGLRWALQFRKYSHLMAQLTIDMWARATADASPEERKVARAQLMYLYGTQAALVGGFSVAGLEILKLGFGIAAALGLGGGWADTEDELRKMIEETFGLAGSAFNDGLLSLSGIDFQSRMNQSDLILGYAPRDTTAEGQAAWVGRLLLGAPGATVIDWGQAAIAAGKGDIESALRKAMPMKQAVDILDAITGSADGRLTPFEAGVKTLGFRSMDTAREERKKSADIRGNSQRKSEEKDLRNQLIKALDRGDKKAEFAARRAIREYNQRLKKLGREEKKQFRPLSPEAIKKYWRRDKKNIYGDE